MEISYACAVIKVIGKEPSQLPAELSNDLFLAFVCKIIGCGLSVCQENEHLKFICLLCAQRFILAGRLKAFALAALVVVAEFPYAVIFVKDVCHIGDACLPAFLFIKEGIHDCFCEEFRFGVFDCEYKAEPTV